MKTDQNAVTLHFSSFFHATHLGRLSISGRSFTSRNADVITPVTRAKMFYLYTEVKLLVPFNQ